MEIGRWILLGMLFLLAMTTTSRSVWAQETIDIQGQAENGTPGSEVPQEMVVTLQVFQLGERLETTQTVTDAGDKFSFIGVPGGVGFGYSISTHHEGVLYLFERDYPLPSGPVKLVVYESTSTTQDIAVADNSLVVTSVDRSDRELQMLEVVRLVNHGTRSLVPDLSQPGMSFLRFSLPPLATELEVTSDLGGGQIVQIDRGFALTAPVPPGEHEVIFVYRTSYEGDILAFSRSFPFGARAFRLLIPVTLGGAGGVGLEEMEMVTLEGTSYRLMMASDLGPGDTLGIQIHGLPQPSWWQRMKEALWGRGLAVAGIPLGLGMVMLVMLAYGLLSRKGPLKTMAAVGGAREERRTLAEAIARMDDQFQGREMKEGEYLKRRWELKAQLLGLATSRMASAAQDSSRGGHLSSIQAMQERGEE